MWTPRGSEPIPPAPLPPFDVPPDDPRIDALTPELARRLRPVCVSMPAEQFDAMLREIARTRLRWP
jgi:hypothetical protein